MSRRRPTDAPPLVAHVIYALDTGGLENGLVNILNRCPPSRYRHAVICLTRATDFAGRITAPNVEIIELHKKPGHDFAVHWRLWRVLKRLRPAIVHTRNLAALETQILGLVMPGVKRVHGEHGRDVRDLDGSNSKLRWFRRLLSPLIHRFITVSKDLENWLVNDVGIPARKVVQIYNGVDHERFAAGHHRPTWSEVTGRRTERPSEGLFVVGTVGRLAQVKDQALVPRALARLLGETPALRETLRCMIVGDGPERARLESLVAENDLAEQVFFAGDRHDVPALLETMDVFLLPSLGEGISNTILEAMASGRPVIATRVGGNPELVEHDDTGLLVEAGDVEALAAAIVRLQADEALRLRMSQAAVDRVQGKFDWDLTVERYLTVYDALLGRTRTPDSPARL